MRSVYSGCFIFFILPTARVESAQWSATSLPEGQKLYACAGDTATLTWQYALTSQEVVGDVQWLYDGQSQELVAMSSRGAFLVSPSFSQRVSRVDNAGLSLSRVLVQDSGNYSVEVNVYTQGGTVHIVLRRTAVLYVSDRLTTTDGVLHVTQLRDPVYDSVSNQWVLQLQCGNFNFKDNPPYHVEWTTPSGEVLNSTSFSNGNFYLSIPMPIESGSYTCRIPAHLSTRACLHGSGSSEGRATVTVESVEARLLLLEKENSDLKHKLAASQVEMTLASSELSATRAELSSRLTSQNQAVAELERRLNALQASHYQEVQRLNSQLNQTQSQLSSTAADLQTRLGKMEDADRNQVAFHAFGLDSTTVAADTPLVFNSVFYNQGNGYNESTGYFTAPYSGLYFFVAKTSGNEEGGFEYHYLMVDNIHMDYAFAVNPAGSKYANQSPVHGLVHLTPGQRVYVVSAFNRKFWDFTSSFTGFLLSRDP